MRLSSAAVVLATALALACAPAFCAVFAVDSALDEPDVALGDGLCLSVSGKCTLRAAVQQANALGGVNMINVPAGTYTLSLGPLSTTNPSNVLTINGNGSWLETIIDGGLATQIFNLQGGQAILNNLVLQNGRFVVTNQGAFGVCVGGAIFVRGTGAPAVVTVNGSVIMDNEVVNGSGGGVCVSDDATFNLVDSTVVDNLGTFGGGGIRNTAGTVNISHSTISGNETASVGPGGAGIENQSVLTVVNSTVSGNLHTVSGTGAGIAVESGSATIVNSTIASNTGSSQFFAGSGTTVNITSTIIANPVGGANCVISNTATLISGGHNLESAQNCKLLAGSDLHNTNPSLAALSDNGGPTATHALLGGSPAIGAGSNPQNLTTDQRGPGYPRSWSNVTDIGAYQTGAGGANANEWVRRAYIAYYGRPADHEGLAYWARRMDMEGGSLASIINAFGSSDEFDRRYGGMTDEQLVVSLYQQTLGRDPEDGGKQYYLNLLATGQTTIKTITLDLLGGATGQDALTVANRLDVAGHFTGKVTRGCPYGSEQIGVDSLAQVYADQASVWAAKAATDVRCGW